MMSVAFIYCYAEYHYAECRGTMKEGCHDIQHDATQHNNIQRSNATHNAYAKCHDVECLLLSVTIKATMLNVVILNVMAPTTTYIYSS